MMQRDREFEQFLHWSLHAAAESIAVRDDGLDRIRSRLAEVRRAAPAGRGEPLVLRTKRPAAHEGDARPVIVIGST